MQLSGIFSDVVEYSLSEGNSPSTWPVSFVSSLLWPASDIDIKIRGFCPGFRYISSIYFFHGKAVLLGRFFVSWEENCGSKEAGNDSNSVPGSEKSYWNSWISTALFWELQCGIVLG